MAWTSADALALSNMNIVAAAKAEYEAAERAGASPAQLNLISDKANAARSWLSVNGYGWAAAELSASSRNAQAAYAWIDSYGAPELQRQANMAQASAVLTTSTQGQAQQHSVYVAPGDPPAAPGVPNADMTNPTYGGYNPGYTQPAAPQPAGIPWVLIAAIVGAAIVLR